MFDSYPDDEVVRQVKVSIYAGLRHVIICLRTVLNYALNDKYIRLRVYFC